MRRAPRRDKPRESGTLGRYLLRGITPLRLDLREPLARIAHGSQVCTGLRLPVVTLGAFETAGVFVERAAERFLAVGERREACDIRDVGSLDHRELLTHDVDCGAHLHQRTARQHTAKDSPGTIQSGLGAMLDGVGAGVVACQRAAPRIAKLHPLPGVGLIGTQPMHDALGCDRANACGGEIGTAGTIERIGAALPLRNHADIVRRRA
jgi:hypothetical protein